MRKAASATGEHVPTGAGATSVHCLSCGKKIRDGIRICPKCGNDTLRASSKYEPPDEVGEPDTGAEAAGARASGVKMAGWFSNPTANALLGGAAAVGTVAAIPTVARFGMKMKKDADRGVVEELVAKGKLPASDLAPLQKAAGLRSRGAANPVSVMRKAAKKWVGKLSTWQSLRG